MPTAIYTEQVTDPMTWTGADFPSKEDFAFDLSARNVAALESILLATAKKDRDEITPADARHPDLDDDLARLYQDLMFGKGLACVRGFPVEQHSIEDLERIYWAFCTHLGLPGVEQLVRSSHGARAGGDSARRRAARARHQVARRAGDAQRCRRHPVAAVRLPGGRGRREPVLKWPCGTQPHPGRTTRPAQRALSGFPAPPSQRAT